MRLLGLFTLALLAPLALAQASTTSSGSRTSSSPSSTNSTQTSSHSLSSGLTVLTTTLVSTPTSAPSGSTAQPTSYVLTLTLNSSDLSSSLNATLNSTALNGMLTNSTNATVPWNETDHWLPFHIVIDPAYGTLGGVLILTGIPVAVLGGKNRWSSLAIATSYCLMLFTLVLILRFGVKPNLQPPSPSPPSTTLRGLYLLACLIASFFGAGLGIFMYNFAQYWVSAAGGFAFGWYLLATRPGGLVHSVLGRWGLLGGLTVGGLIASLPKVLNPHMMLISTAWIGATAFTLGVDCYTRAGLKEFYIYNLGFHDLFPSLNGGNYPLTQTMEIELGILAAVVLIGAAIQFRILNILQKRLKQMREEEEARIDAEEVEKAAERFKNVGVELDEWEEKYGNGVVNGRGGPSRNGNSGVSPASAESQFYSGNASAMRTGADRSSIALPSLGFESEHEPRRDGRASSTLSLLRNADGRGAYEGVGSGSPALPGPDTPTSTMFMSLEELKSPHDTSIVPNEPPTPITADDSELESKLRLLQEVKRAREEVRGSLDKLRATTPTSLLSDTPGITGRNVATPTPTLGGLSDGTRSRTISSASRMLDYSTTAPLARPPPERAAIQSEWDMYVAERKVYTPPALGRSSSAMQASLSGNPFAVEGRREKTISMLEPRVSDFGPREELRHTDNTYPVGGSSEQLAYTHRERVSSDRPATYHDYLNQTPETNLGTPNIIGSAARSGRPSSQAFPQHQQQQRAMTYEELAERHRKRLSKLQDPITSKMKEEIELAQAKKRWEKQQRLEREAMKRREQEHAASGPGAGTGVAGTGERRRQGSKEEMGKGKQQVRKSTDEWRRSVVLPSATPMTGGGGSGGGSGSAGGRAPQKRSSTYFAS